MPDEPPDRTRWGSALSEVDIQRLRRIELKLDAILDHLGVEPPKPHGLIPAEIGALVGGGRKVYAVMLYRACTGAGLEEAIAAVEAIDAGQSLPPKPTASPKPTA